MAGAVGILLLLVLLILWMRRRARQRRQGVEPEGLVSYLARNLRDYGWWPFGWRLQRDLTGHGPAEYVDGGHRYHLQTIVERAAAPGVAIEVQATGSAPVNGYGQVEGGEGGRRRNGSSMNGKNDAANHRQAGQNLRQERKR